MYGARSATERSVGVLKAKFSVSSLADLPNRQPLWQATQAALPLNNAKPRLAAALIAVSSPATQRSNGVIAGSSVRSNAASAVANSSDIDWPAGQGALNFAV
jgi:hypothetical protein